MPRVMIEADDTWWTNWQAVMDTAMDTCQGLATQLRNHVEAAPHEPPPVIYEVAAQLDQLGQQLKAVRLPF